MIRAVLLFLLLVTAGAQAAELKIATWNIQWLTLRQAGDPALPENVVTRQPGDFALLRRYARALDADVVAFQEVDGPEAAAQVFPPERYALVLTDDAVVQRTGFAIRRGIAFERHPDLVALDTQPQSPFRLRSGADISVILPGGRLRLLNVHLKSGCHQGRLGDGNRSCDTLRRQIPPLQGWLAARVREGEPFAVLGDLNRRMDGKDEMLDQLNAITPLARATEGLSTACWGGNSFIDHVLAGGAARSWLVRGSLRVMVYGETDPAFRDRISDHCPVSVRFRLPD